MNPTENTQEFYLNEISKLEKELEKYKDPHQKINAIKYYILEHNLIQYLPDEKVKPVLRFKEGRHVNPPLEYPDTLTQPSDDQQKYRDEYYKTFCRWYYGVIADFYGYNEMEEFNKRRHMYDFFQILLSTIAKIELFDNAFYLVLKSGNKITSRIEAQSVKSITKRSIPMPSPAVGGKPYSNAVT